MHKITLKNGEVFFCSEDETILGASKRNGFFLNHSCKTGKCGACKADFLGETKILKEETFFKQGVDTNKLLTCCRAPKSDLVIEAEDISELAKYPSKIIPCKINEIRKIHNENINDLRKLKTVESDSHETQKRPKLSGPKVNVPEKNTFITKTIFYIYTKRFTKS